MKYLALTLLLLGGMSYAARDVSADDVGAIRLLDTAVVNSDSSPTVQVTPVRIGWGWRGPGWYPGNYRPYGSYGSYYRPYRGYYGGYGYPGRYYNYYRAPGAYGPYWRY